MALEPSRTTVLDGAWWPRSTDPAAELPTLVNALAGRRTEISHLLTAGEWDLPHPRKTAAGPKGVRLGRYISQPTGLITIISEFGRDRGRI